MAKKVILDVDTGSDDAVALVTALLSPDLELVAACTVWGNRDIDKTTENTLRVMDSMRSNVPVYKGCGTAMVKYLAHNRTLDRKELKGHPYLPLPEATSKPESISAVEFYLDYLRNATEPVTLIPVGPLTNVGMALRIEPEIVKNIDKIIIMGGGYDFSNKSICAEANIWNDPEAAQIVVESGAEILFVPLDATQRAYLTLEDCKRFRELGNFAGNFVAEMVELRIAYSNVHYPSELKDTAPVHDALAVCAAIDETVLTDVRHVHCEIGLGGFGEGQTIIDNRHSPEEKNVYFAFGSNRNKFSEMLYEIFARCSLKQ